MAETLLERETFWYLEKWDNDLQDWNGLRPCREHLSENSVRAEFAIQRRLSPGLRLRIIRERRERFIVQLG